MYCRRRSGMELCGAAMSEFKFACPVCGQHLTAHATNSGSQIDCPTCFRRIIVPQAPSSDSKLIVSAAQPASARPGTAASNLGPLRKRKEIPLGGLAVLLLLAGAVGAAYHFRHSLFGLAKGTSLVRSLQESNTTNSAAAPQDSQTIEWGLDLDRARIPERVAAGSIRGRSFACEQATLAGGALSLRQGRGWPPDLAIAVVLPVKEGEQLGGKAFRVGPAQGPAYQVIVRWKDGQQAQRQEFTKGYALKLTFGEPAAGRMPGKVYLAVPDEDRSVVAGTFNAEIKPAPRGP